MATIILATKLYIPPPRPIIVLRARLIERLNEGHLDFVTVLDALASNHVDLLKGTPRSGAETPVSLPLTRVRESFGSGHQAGRPRCHHSKTTPTS